MSFISGFLSASFLFVTYLVFSHVFMGIFTRLDRIESFLSQAFRG